MKKKSMRIIVLLLLSTYGLSGCALLAPVKAPVRSHYALNQASTAVMGKNHQRTTVAVSHTTARAGFDTNNMVYLQKAYHLEHYGKNQWVAKPSVMFTSLLMESLSNSRSFTAVVGAGLRSTASWQLNSELLYLQQNFMGEHNQVEMSVSAQLIDRHRARVVASQTFKAVVPTISADPYGGVLAANLATQQILEKIARFVVEHTK